MTRASHAPSGIVCETNIVMTMEMAIEAEAAGCFASSFFLRESTRCQSQTDQRRTRDGHRTQREDADGEEDNPAQDDTFEGARTVAGGVRNAGRSRRTRPS
jgi:hypothetical protein